MALKKSELYGSLWQSCDELRGGMDASQYKDYGLVLLFIKYVSDKYAGHPYGAIKVPGEVLKDIKNVHLSVYPPAGRVRISAPRRMNLGTIRVFAISRLDWIKQQQKKLRGQERETSRDYVERESHWVWGKRYLLHIIERDGPPSLELRHKRMILYLRPGTSEQKRGEIVEEWYRAQLKAAVPALLSRWQPLFGVGETDFFV